MKTRFWDNLKPEHKIIYFCLFVVVFVLFLFFFVVKPAADNMIDIKDEIKQERIALEEKYLQGLNAKLISGKVDEIEDNLAALNSIFVKEGGYLDLVTSLENLAQRNNVEEKINILNDKSEKKRTYRAVPVHIEAKGEFSDLLAFLSGLKSFSYKFDINSLRIKSENPDPVRVLKQRPRKETERVSASDIIKMDEAGTTTTSTEEEIVIQKNSTSSEPVKDVSMMILGELYWKK